MPKYDEELKELQSQKVHKAHLEAVLTDLEQQEKDLQKKVSVLGEQKNREQLDVDRLEGHGLTAFFYQISGKKEEKLEKEKMEAYAAAAKYDSAVQELQAVEAQIKTAKSEWEAIKNCECRFEDVIKQKSAWIKEQGNPKAEELLELENKQNEAQSQIKEIKEAIEIGESAISLMYNIEEILDKADSLAMWDMGRGGAGGMLVDMVKYDELETVEEQIVALQMRLRRFKTELVDVSIVEDIRVEIDEWTEFIDIFYDNIFTDWKVKKHITNTKNELLGVGEQVSNVLTRLQNLLVKRQAESKQLQESIDVLVLNVHE